MKVSLAVLALLGATDALKIKNKVHNAAKLHNTAKLHNKAKVEVKAKTQAERLNPHVASSVMEYFDTNGDGMITVSEFGDHLKEMCGGDDNCF